MNFIIYNYVWEHVISYICSSSTNIRCFQLASFLTYTWNWKKPRTFLFVTKLSRLIWKSSFDLTLFLVLTLVFENIPLSCFWNIRKTPLCSLYPNSWSCFSNICFRFLCSTMRVRQKYWWAHYKLQRWLSCTIMHRASLLRFSSIFYIDL